jgi:hypothetical protein
MEPVVAQIEEETRCACEATSRPRPPCLTSDVEAYTARLVHLFPLAEHVCCRLSEDQDQFHEVSRFHLAA